MSLNKNKNLSPVITRVFYAFTYNIDAVKTGVDDNHKQVVFKTGTWIEIYKVPKNVNFEETPKRSEAGVVYEQKLSLMFPGDDESNITDFNDLESKPLVVKFEYDNAKARIIGDKGNPAKVNISYSTDRGGSSVNFQCTPRNRAYWL